MKILFCDKRLYELLLPLLREEEDLVVRLAAAKENLEFITGNV